MKMIEKEGRRFIKADRRTMQAKEKTIELATSL